MTDAALGFGLAMVALLLFSTAILTTKAASNRIPLSLGFLIATVVNVGFSAVALGVQLAWQQQGLQWNGLALALFAVAGAFSTYLGRWFFYESVVRFGPAKASIFQVSSPLFTALIAWLVLGERLGPVAALGMFMAVGGLMLVSTKPGFFPGRQAIALDAGGVEAAAPSLPATQALGPGLHARLLQSVFLLGLGSSMAYAIGNVLRGSAVRVWPEPVLGGLVGAVCGLALHLVFSRDKLGLLMRLREADRKGAWLYALIGVATISAQMCVIAAMRYIPLSIVTLVTLCTPLLVFPLSYSIYKTKSDLNRNTLLGSALTLLGVAIIVFR
jgi:drug/metabolite transporter (DMT)-like permease